MKPQQPHQHGPNCNHGPGGHSHSQGNSSSNQHSHSHGSGQCKAHGHGSHSHGPQKQNFFFPFQLSFPQYKDSMKKMWQSKQQRQFVWLQIFSGSFIQRYLLYKNLLILRLFSCMPLTFIAQKFQSQLNLQCFPNQVRALVGGMMIPLLLILYFLHNVFQTYQSHNDNTGLVQEGKQSSFSLQSIPMFQLFTWSIYITIFFYIIAALRGSGNISTKQNQKHTKQAIKTRPYLQNHNMMCAVCKILKAYRSFHCYTCKQCIPKFTKHSIIFNQCIGASNQFGVMMFLLSLTITGILGYCQFFTCFFNSTLEPSQRIGYFSSFIVCYLLWFITWYSFVQFSRMLVHNIYYGITQYELTNWSTQQYLLKIPMRQFQNNVNCGMLHNLKQSIIGFLGISGVQKQIMNSLNSKYNRQDDQDQQDDYKIDDEVGQKQSLEKRDQKLKKILAFPKPSSNNRSDEKLLVNWSRAYCYLMPMIVNHPMRDFLIQMMEKEEPKMITNFRLSLKLKQEVIEQNKNQGGQPLTDQQLGQRVMMKMQQHMMKQAQKNKQNGGPNSMNPMMMMRGQMAMHGDPNKQPSPQQKKTIMIQILTHLSQDIKQHPQKVDVDRLMSDLKSDKITPMDVNVQLRQIQQNIMKRKMQEMMKQHQQRKNMQISGNSGMNLPPNMMIRGAMMNPMQMQQGGQSNQQPNMMNIMNSNPRLMQQIQQMRAAQSQSANQNGNNMINNRGINPPNPQNNIKIPNISEVQMQAPQIIPIQKTIDKGQQQQQKSLMRRQQQIEQDD